MNSHTPLLLILNLKCTMIIWDRNMEISLELEDMTGEIHFKQNSPEELEKANLRYMRNQFGGIF